MAIPKSEGFFVETGGVSPSICDPNMGTIRTSAAATIRKMQIIEEPAEQGQHFMVGHPRGPLFWVLGRHLAPTFH